MPPQVETLPASQVKEQTNVNPFGSGRYSELMSSAYEQIQVVFPSVPEEIAMKIAKQIGSDFGAAMRNSKVDAKIGKTIRDGKVTLAEAAKAKGVHATHSLVIMHSLAFAEQAGKYGFAWQDTEFAVLKGSPLSRALEAFKIETSSEPESESEKIAA
jgi:hypothetical protein